MIFGGCSCGDVRSTIRRAPGRIVNFHCTLRFVFPRRGTPIACRVSHEPEPIEATVGSLEQVAGFEPNAAVHVGSRLLEDENDA